MEGIIEMSSPGQLNPGIFRLPAQFDTKLFAASWVKKGPEVEAARGVQPILGTSKGATGWEIWRYPAKHPQAGKPCTVTSKAGEFILMFRKRNIQDNVNAIYGNVSKRHLMKEQTGEVLDSKPVGDRGVLTHSRLQKMGMQDFGDDYQVNLPENPESSAPLVSPEPDAVGTTQGNIQTQTTTET